MALLDFVVEGLRKVAMNSLPTGPSFILLFLTPLIAHLDTFGRFD